MGRFLRWLLPFSSTWISREEALRIAAQAAEDRGYVWTDPVGALRHYGDWSVRSAANLRGGNVAVIVNGGSGEVKSVSGPTPR